MNGVKHESKPLILTKFKFFYKTVFYTSTYNDILIDSILVVEEIFGPLCWWAEFSYVFKLPCQTLFVFLFYINILLSLQSKIYILSKSSAVKTLN